MELIHGNQIKLKTLLYIYMYIKQTNYSLKSPKMKCLLRYHNIHKSIINTYIYYDVHCLERIDHLHTCPMT